MFWIMFKCLCRPEPACSVDVCDARWVLPVVCGAAVVPAVCDVLPHLSAPHRTDQCHCRDQPAVCAGLGLAHFAVVHTIIRYCFCTENGVSFLHRFRHHVKLVMCFYTFQDIYFSTN